MIRISSDRDAAFYATLAATVLLPLAQSKASGCSCKSSFCVDLTE
ncbi:hypothetical protein CSC17_1809 [Klebsiella oxytoca]|jgi:hypothetical protein|nr:hypothetical protein CSC17_1809 [Klebsiella oxytoca]